MPEIANCISFCWEEETCARVSLLGEKIHLAPTDSGFAFISSSVNQEQEKQNGFGHHLQEILPLWNLYLPHSFASYCGVSSRKATKAIHLPEPASTNRQNEENEEFCVVPMAMQFQIQVTAISCGTEHILMSCEDSKGIFMMGRNTFNQLGPLEALANGNGGDTFIKQVDVLKRGFIPLCNLCMGIELSEDSRVLKVCAGSFHSFCLVSKAIVTPNPAPRDGRAVLVSWGRNDLGQLGHGTTSAPVAVPHVVTGLVFDSVDEEVLDIFAGCNHSVALTKETRVYSWGCNLQGCLGHGTVSTAESTPKVISFFDEFPLPIKSVSCGRWTTLFRTSGGSNIFTAGVRPDIRSVQSRHFRSKQLSEVGAHSNVCRGRAISFRSTLDTLTSQPLVETLDGCECVAEFGPHNVKPKKRRWTSVKNGVEQLTDYLGIGSKLIGHWSFTEWHNSAMSLFTGQSEMWSEQKVELVNNDGRNNDSNDERNNDNNDERNNDDRRNNDNNDGDNKGSAEDDSDDSAESGTLPPFAHCNSPQLLDWLPDVAVGFSAGESHDIAIIKHSGGGAFEEGRLFLFAWGEAPLGFLGTEDKKRGTNCGEDFRIFVFDLGFTSNDSCGGFRFDCKASREGAFVAWAGKEGMGW